MIDVLRHLQRQRSAGRYLNFVGCKTVNGKRAPVFRYFNVNKARIKGVGDRSAGIPFGEEWKLTVNYTYNDGRDLSNGGDKPSCRRCRSTPPTAPSTGKPLDDWSFYVTANCHPPAARGRSATGKAPGGYTLFRRRRRVAGQYQTSNCAPACLTWATKI